MSGLTPTRQNALLLVALLFAQLLLMSASVRGAEGSSLLEGAVFRVSEPLVGVTHFVSGGFGGVGRRLRELGTARTENAALRGELDRLRDELARSQEASLENERLRRLLHMREELAPRSVGASVVTASLAGQTKMIVIDRGTEQGVRPDLPVVAWGGAVGRVIFASGSRAKVRLLSDPNAGAAGLVQRSRAQGMVVGRGDGPMAMLYMPAYADVVLGDRVITSGLDGVFPRGFGIGRVNFVGDAVGVSKTVHLEPEIPFASLEEVLVILEPSAGGEALAIPEPEAEP